MANVPKKVHGTHIRYRKRAFSTKYLSDAFFKGTTEVFREMTQSWADGFNKITKSWNDPVKFYPIVRPEPGTKRLFAYVGKSGTQAAINHFDWLDKGLRRDKEIKVPMVGGGTRMMPNKVKIEGVDWPKGSTFTKYPRGVPRPRRGKFDKKTFQHSYTESKRSYAAYRKKMEKMYTRHITPRQQAINKYGKDKKMPMRTHKPKTGKGGKYRGSGAYFPRKNSGKKAWHNTPMVYEVVLGDIDARNFTAGLYFIAHKGSDPFRMRHIWPKARTVKQWTDRGYNRGVKYAKASKSSG